MVLKVLEEDEEQEGEGNMQVEMEGVKEISMEGTMLEMSYEDSDWIVGGNVDNALEEPPRLVVAIEKDAIAERSKWKGSDYTRGLQVHQVSSWNVFFFLGSTYAYEPRADLQRTYQFQ